jgi:hypothetical protein
MDYNELIKAWEENRIVILPVPLGTPVYQIHKSYWPKTVNGSRFNAGFDVVYTYDEVEYNLSLYTRKDIYFTEEEAQKAIERLKNET